MEKQTIKNGFLGALDIFMLLPSGIERFSDNRDDAIKSFALPMLFYPFAMISYGLSKHSLNPMLLLTHALVFWIGMFVFLGIVLYSMSRANKKDRIWRFISVNNWFSLIGFLYLLPVFIVVIGFGHSIEPFEPYIVFLIVANMFYTAYITSKVFTIPWELGAFFAVMNMMVDDMSYKFMEVIRTYIITA